MDKELLDALEGRITSLLAVFNAMKVENRSLREENSRLLEERDGFKARIDRSLKNWKGSSLIELFTPSQGVGQGIAGQKPGLCRIGPGG